MKSLKLLVVSSILMSIIAMAQPVRATDRQDLSVALKTLPLLTNKIPSPAPIAIIYDPSSAESKTDAEAIKSIIDSGLEAPGDIKLVPQLVSTGELSKLSGVRIAFLAHELP